MRKYDNNSTIVMSEAKTFTMDWQNFLLENDIFRFSRSADELITFRREAAGSKRGGDYWYAYKTVSGKLKKRYAGKSENLNYAKLCEVADRF